MKKLISIRNAAAMVIMFVAGTFTAFADAPTNDNFSNAEILAGTRLSITRTNVGATKETLEPDHAGNQGGRSVWFRWVAPSSGTVLFSTNRSTSQIDTLLAVADELVEIKTICHTGKKATMVVRVDEQGRAVKAGPQVEIGGNERYVSVSRAEYKKIMSGDGAIELHQPPLPFED